MEQYLAELLRLSIPSPEATATTPSDWLNRWLEIQQDHILAQPPPDALRRKLWQAAVPTFKKPNTWAMLSCPGHRALNLFAMKRLARLLREECDKHMTKYYGIIACSEPGHALQPAAMDLIREVACLLRGVLTLLIGNNPRPLIRVLADPDIVYAADLSPKHRVMRLMDDGCPACKLAIVGSHVRILVALRASILARELAGREGSMILPLVEEWIGLREDCAEHLGRSLDMAKELAQEWQLFGVDYSTFRVMRVVQITLAGPVEVERLEGGGSSGHQDGTGLGS